MQGINEDTGEAQVSVDWQGEAVEPGDPGLERAAAFASVIARTLATAGYHPRRLSVGVRREPHGVLQLNVNLELDGALETSSIAAAPPRAKRDWSLYARIGGGVAVGLLLGVLGLPRIELPFAAPTAPRATLAPTLLPAQQMLAQPVEVEAEPTAAPPTPTVVRGAPASARAAPTPIARPSQPELLFAERFVSPLPNWPDDLRGTAWFADGEYHLFARDPGRFVATGVPLQQPAHDVKLSAQFHKVEGPAGGGYGLIVRDQASAGERDGLNQSGQYLVLEVGDRGDIGVWQRERTRWIDIVPWTHSDAVRLERASNVLTVRSQGPALQFEVNGMLVADLIYDRIAPDGGVGVFVGGDLNEVALEWLRIENL